MKVCLQGNQVFFNYILVHKVEEGLAKKINYMLFQEAKIERMITKYDKFNEKAK